MHDNQASARPIHNVLSLNKIFKKFYTDFGFEGTILVSVVRQKNILPLDQL